MWYVYILECGDGTLYTGVTTDVQRRFSEHANGTGAKYTRARGAVRVVYTEECGSRPLACRREAVIKGMRRHTKLALIRSK